ncbi:MAG TPA: adenine deaminase [Bacteroidales bacterium]|nr:adenine deaminase [Bacteroidales bacterium]HRZ21036.1 adenine deaminase [Bacteroidales bacterium]
MKGTVEIEGRIVDVKGRRIFPGRILVEDGIICRIDEAQVSSRQYILPGLIDAHVHIESSMLIPSEFARLAVVHGTVATVSDPHEIANVLGMEGVRFMIRNGNKTPFKFFFGAPSCVPATSFESSGATLGLAEVDELLQMPEIHYLSEMMNFPGVLHDDPVVNGKLLLARKYGKPVDGHAPGLRGEQAGKYIRAGIFSDHECFGLDEAMDKAGQGMHILIREGSAAKNFDDLIPLLKHYPGQVMFCSDDKHPDDLVVSHINDLVKRALRMGYDLFDVLQCCTVNPVHHYKLPVGLLRKGDPADMTVVSDLTDFEVLATYIHGMKVSEKRQTLLPQVEEETPNIFHASRITPDELVIPAEGKQVRIIQALDGQLITGIKVEDATLDGGWAVADTERDLLKLVVMNRYRASRPVTAFIHGFGLKRGAIASTVAHDSHNIIAVGASDQDLADAINLLIDHRGGVSFSDNAEKEILPLPVGGIMSNHEGYQVASRYRGLNARVRDLGSTLKAPYMTLSFMALLVIPHLKLSDQGLFDGSTFRFTSLFIK